jgi:hypothetical protein
VQSRRGPDQPERLVRDFCGQDLAFLERSRGVDGRRLRVSNAVEFSKRRSNNPSLKRKAALLASL